VAGPPRPQLRRRAGEGGPRLPAPCRGLQRQRPGRHPVVRAGKRARRALVRPTGRRLRRSGGDRQRTYRPLLGDFNGDGRGDIFWYGPGSAPDVFWYGHADGGFAGRAVTVNGTYQPLPGDFNGDRSRDILWYGWRGRRPLVRAPQRRLHRPHDRRGGHLPALHRRLQRRRPARHLLVRPGRRLRRHLVRELERQLRARGGHRAGHLPASGRRLRRRRPQRRALVGAGPAHRRAVVRPPRPPVHIQVDHGRPGLRACPGDPPGDPRQPVRPLRVRRPRLRRDRRPFVHQHPGGVPAQLRPRFPRLRDRQRAARRRDRAAGARRPGGQLRPQQAPSRRRPGPTWPGTGTSAGTPSCAARTSCTC
jgi:hypothetical protein